MQRLQTPRRRAQGRSEAPDAEARQATPHPVDDAGALADQALPLPVRALGVLFLERRDRDHAAVVRLAAQPAEEGPPEQPGVEPVRLRPPMLARHGDARRVNHVGFDAMRPQPARQPKTIAAGLEGDGHARDRAAGPGRLALPAPQQLEQRLLVRLELLQWMAFDPWNNRGDEPARLAHLDDRDERGFVVQAGGGSAQIIPLRHRALPGLSPAAIVLQPCRPPHSVGAEARTSGARGGTAAASGTPRRSPR